VQPHDHHVANKMQNVKQEEEKKKKTFPKYEIKIVVHYHI
jgi:hypothetical protein